MREASPAGRAEGRHARERRPSGEERADRAKRSAPGVGGDTQLDQSESRLVARHRRRDSKRERAISARNNADGMSAKAITAVTAVGTAPSTTFSSVALSVR